MPDLTGDALWTSDLLVAAAIGQLDGSITQTITGFSIDTRSIAAGDVFVALKDVRDGHEFVTAAFTAGAAAALVSASYVRKPGDGALIRVDDPLRALERIGSAARARLSPDARVIAVTGSVGKTSTKEMLRTALSGVGQTHAAAKSFNNHWGVPLTLARMPADARFGVFEIGMNHSGEIAPLARMVRPHVAIITTVEPVHLAAFASVDEIADAKAEIFEGLQVGVAASSSPPCAARDFDASAATPGRSTVETVAILNRDNAFFDRLADSAMAADAQILSFGEHPHATVRLTDLVLSADRSLANVVVPSRGLALDLSIGLVGKHQIKNALAVVAACLSVCRDEPELRRAMQSLEKSRAQAGRGGFQWLRRLDGTLIGLIDDSYNANPASVRAALAAMSFAPALAVHLAPTLPPDWEGSTAQTRAAISNSELQRPRRIAVLGDMLELGATAAALHVGLMPAIEDAGVDKVFACGPHMKHLFDALPVIKQGEWAATSKELVGPLLAGVKPGDVIMVKGSLGSRMAVIVEALTAQVKR